MTALYRLSDLERFFGEHCVLSISALEIPEGGLTAIVGANGAGKTTLLRLLAFLDKPTRGDVWFRGNRDDGAQAPRADAEPLRRRRQPITMVDQNPYLFRGTVELNVAYGPRALGLPREERMRRVRRALEDVGLTHLARQHANRLSGGEKRRVALARALATGPNVFLLDEPFAELDREHAAKTEQILRDRGSSGTVIFTTHDLAQAHHLANQVIPLVGGRVSPVPLVNLFRGSIARRGGVPTFHSIDIEFEVPNTLDNATLAAVDPEAIVVSSEPLHSSARNSFRGTVIHVESRDAIFHLTINCGARLVAAVTRQSYDDLALNVGREVWVTFKSTAVHLY